MPLLYSHELKKAQYLKMIIQAVCDRRYTFIRAQGGFYMQVFYINCTMSAPVEARGSHAAFSNSPFFLNAT